MENKPWYLSRTIWGAIAAILAAGLAAFGKHLSPDGQSVIADRAVDVAAAVATIVGGVVAIYGRVKAETKIGNRG